MFEKRCSRRGFLWRGVQVAGGLLAGPNLLAQTTTSASAPGRKFEISLAAWSVHRLIFSGQLKQMDLPELCRREFDIGGLELVNTFFPSPQYTYCRELRRRADDQGVKILLIMCDGEGDMCHRDPTERRQAVRNHRKWLDVASVLGCHSIRCNAGDAQPGDQEAIRRCAESFAELLDYARPEGLHVLIENHGGLSSDPDSLLAVLRRVDDPLLGTLPDFGNFPPTVDRYEAVRRMMPYARAVSAKCYRFDADGNEVTIDYARMMRVVLDSGYRGYIGIEYEGPGDDEKAGVRACQRLLQRFQ
jgi:sugar phosphate isomerase/epimerase